MTSSWKHLMEKNNLRVCGGRKLAGFIHGSMTEVVQKKGTGASGGDGGGCGGSDRVTFVLGLHQQCLCG